MLNLKRFNHIVKSIVKTLIDYLLVPEGESIFPLKSVEQLKFEYEQSLNK